MWKKNKEKQCVTINEFERTGKLFTDPANIYMPD